MYLLSQLELWNTRMQELMVDVFLFKDFMTFFTPSDNISFN